MAQSHYLLKKSTDGQYYWNLKAPNNETILTSERYVSHQGATNGIASCKLNSGNPARYTRNTSKSGKPYFVLKAANHEPIGTSEEYSSVQARENGIKACTIYGPTAPIVDQTK